jgi:hypothetical protein
MYVGGGAIAAIMRRLAARLWWRDGLVTAAGFPTEALAFAAEYQLPRR